MAKPPKKSSASRVSNIIDAVRGNFDFKVKPAENTAVPYGSSELISHEQRSRILSGSMRAVDNVSRQSPSAGSLLNMVQTSLMHVGQDRLENRQILQLMPEVDKAARLMVASIFSPNDLARHEIAITFDSPEFTDSHKNRLSEFATKFFQDKLNLKTAAPKWVYQFGYETGASVFAVVPLLSFQSIQDDSYLGLESFVKKVIDPVSQESVFGFGDGQQHNQTLSSDVQGLETFGTQVLRSVDNGVDKADQKVFINGVSNDFTKAFVTKVIGLESLSLTDNPSILQLREDSKAKRQKRTKAALNTRFKMPRAETIVSVSAEPSADGKNGVIGNPILMRLPPESVTVIHTPGDPSDHQGYLILLDHTGSPVNAITMEEANKARGVNYNQNQANIFSQTYNAYGIGGSGRGSLSEETMGRVYTQIVSEHLRKRLDRAGFSNVEMSNVESTFRCMFGRFLQQKQTRILFLPKELVSYMAFELDQHGYGVSRLEGVKFNLGLKMAVQVSRVLAAIKAAMDKRRIEVKFTDNMMEQPEAVFQDVIRQYRDKQSMSFSIDPNQVQSQIIDKSISIKGTDIPGMEQFDLINEPDTRTGTVDFDPSMLEYLDKAITNGMRIPAATMNSLGEDEYARSVATTNLFFSMDVSIDQDIVIRSVSDLLRKYARYSEEFQKGLCKIFPSLEAALNGASSTDEGIDKGEGKKEDETDLPGHFTVDSIIDLMTVSLPKPNVAPDKTQFEALDGMITAITSMVNALFPDELAANDDTLRPVIGLLRAKFTAENIRSYIETSGLAGFELPDTHFSPQLKDISTLLDGLRNVAAMLDDKAKIGKPVESEEMSLGGVAGYN